MLVVYDTQTQNVQRFVDKLQRVRTLKIEDGLIVDEPYVLITYTINFGEVPTSTERFLVVNYKMLSGVCSSGNKNWADNFGKAGEIIAKRYDVPLLHKFELSGFVEDVAIVQKELDKLDGLL